TYANYREANLSFWRQTVLPLVNRTAKALSRWLGEGAQLRPDVDAIEALNSERERLWQRVQAADFLTLNEKRALVGYGPVDGGDALARGASQADPL
ncbi:MAG: phage portal protein, partial [Alphaproteobacteria bacterium]